MEGEKRTSPWVFVGIGCLAAFLALAAIVIAIGWLSFQQIQQIQETMENPEARAKAATEMLGATEIPQGYHTVMALSVPFLMETVLLSDREPNENGQIEGFDESGFIYVKTLTRGEQKLRDFFEGRTEDSDILDQQPVHVSADELVGRGSFELPGRTLRWVAYRGEIAAGSGNGAQLGEGLSSMILMGCPDDDRMRLGIWFGPDPDPDTPVDEADFRGTVVDEAEIRGFMEPLDVCSR